MKPQETQPKGQVKTCATIEPSQALVASNGSGEVPSSTAATDSVVQTLLCQHGNKLDICDKCNAPAANQPKGMTLTPERAMALIDRVTSNPPQGAEVTDGEMENNSQILASLAWEMARDDDDPIPASAFLLTKADITEDDIKFAESAMQQPRQSHE